MARPKRKKPRHPNQKNPPPPPLGNKRAVGNKGGGRPTLYRKEYCETARRLCLLGATAEEGLTDLQLAAIFRIDVDTLGLWKRQHPDFYQALYESKQVADANVVASLYSKAVGHKHPAVKIFMPSGSRKPVIVPYVEVYAPDTRAAELWLTNRRPRDWKTRMSTDISGFVGAVHFILEGAPPIEGSPDVQRLSPPSKDKSHGE